MEVSGVETLVSAAH